MNFRLFIYYCALCGAWAALVGWTLGRLPKITDPVADSGVQGMLLGFFVSMGLSVVDSFLNSRHQVAQSTGRVVVGTIVGSLGGLMGGMLGQSLYGQKKLPLFLILGWTLVGLLIGASVGVYDLVTRFLKQQDVRGALRKMINGMVGGTVGGFLGGILYMVLLAIWKKLLPNKADLWSPSATGFVVLGMCIGLLIGLAQIILKEAWIRVETGRRAGREMILSNKEITIGRAEACDVGLFGYEGIDKMHARIIMRGNRFMLEDLDSGEGTYVNGELIGDPTPLRSGDAIRVGNCVLRFGERQKRED